MVKVKTKKDTEYISLYRELIVLEPSGNVDLTATLCRKQKNKSPDQNIVLRLVVCYFFRV